MRMFPLGTVLLPGALLPLHVFEPRYRQLVVDSLADDGGEPEFGVVLIARGWEVGGGDERNDVGTVARMIRVGALEGGRYAIVASGTRRIRVNAWLPDDPYPIADVGDWPDEDGNQPGLHKRVEELTGRVAEVLAISGRLGDAPPAVVLGLVSEDPALASFQLAAVAPVGPADQYRLLCAPTPAARLELLATVLDDVEAAFRFRLGASSGEG